MAARTTNVPTYCPHNCSGHGHCHTQGYCVCKVDYTGEACNLVNSKYYVIFGTFFFFLCIVSIVQLIFCLKSEYRRQEKKSVGKLFQMTTQKMLYLIISVATALRGTYYTVILDTESGPLPWMVGLLSAYYPILLTGCSLLVCLWAEEFHLHFSKERPQFLTKSFIAFIVFNAVLYLLLAAEIITTNVLFTDAYSDYLASIFNGCFAGIMLMVIIFFLIYGVEVYFKIHGAFAVKSQHHIAYSQQTNKLQMHMSRCGLLSQACLQLLTAVFLISEILRNIWLDKIPVGVIEFIHYNDFIFRIIEFGVALWFPCVLWNCSRPDKLWVLNPRQLLEDFNKNECEKLISSDRSNSSQYGSLYNPTESDCWICYDSLRKDAGDIISPCLCKGDVATVHHECLRKWLLEYNNMDNMYCKVCREKYSITNHHPSIFKGLRIHHWVQTIVIVMAMTASPVAAALCWSFFDNVITKIAAIGGTLILEYISLRLLGFSAISAYKRAKMSTLKILGNPIHKRICDKSTGSEINNSIGDVRSSFDDEAHEEYREHSVHKVEAVVEVIPKQTL